MEAPGTTPRLIPAYGPLQGLRVLDSGRFVAGPWAATYLGEFGAEVIHLEGPPFGPPYSDPTRTLAPTLPPGAPAESSVSESWVQYSRNKLSVGVDLQRTEGRQLFLDLIAASNIWVESSRPGTFDRLGLGDATLWERNRQLTIVHVSGFGQTGEPDRIRASSFDLVGQAYSGFLSLQGDPDPAPPMRSGTALNDTVTGLAAAAAALMGVISAQRTGMGQAVDVAQYEVFFTLLENLALDYFVRGVVRGRHGTGHARLHPYGVYRAQDGWVVVAAPTEASWRGLAGVLGTVPPEWDDPAQRRDHRAELDRMIGAFASTRSLDQLEAIGREHDLAILRVFDMAAIARDPHFQARGMFEEWEDPVAGAVKGAGVAPKFGTTPGAVWRGAPWLGQDNELVLGRLLGYEPDRISELTRSGVIGSYRPPAFSSAPAPYFQHAEP